mmetsp:Transcript_22739/g.46023  ORF Transcript_22739/g.46023 Transcript_22739/m.46023 type:complete len:612 (-) Transcript_22739:546-2381(-)
MGSGSIFQGHELVFIGTSEITSGSPHDLRKGLILRPIPIRLILHPSPQNTLRILRRPRIAPRPPRQILPLLDIRLRLYLTFRQKLLQPGIRLLRQRIRPHERIEDLPVFLVEGLTTRVVRIEPFAVAIGEEGIVAGEDVDDFGGGAETSSADDFVSVDGDGVVAFAVGAAQSAESIRHGQTVSSRGNAHSLGIDRLRGERSHREIQQDLSALGALQGVSRLSSELIRENFDVDAVISAGGRGRGFVSKRRRGRGRFRGIGGGGCIGGGGDGRGVGSSGRGHGGDFGVGGGGQIGCRSGEICGLGGRDVSGRGCGGRSGGGWAVRGGESSGLVFGGGRSGRGCGCGWVLAGAGGRRGTCRRFIFGGGGRRGSRRKGRGGGGFLRRRSRSGGLHFRSRRSGGFYQRGGGGGSSGRGRGSRCTPRGFRGVIRLRGSLGGYRGGSGGASDIVVRRGSRNQSGIHRSSRRRQQIPRHRRIRRRAGAAGGTGAIAAKHRGIRDSGDIPTLHCGRRRRRRTPPGTGALLLNHRRQLLVHLVVVLDVRDGDPDCHADGDGQGDEEEGEDSLVAEGVGTGGRVGCVLVRVVFRGGDVGFYVSEHHFRKLLDVCILWVLID